MTWTIFILVPLFSAFLSLGIGFYVWRRREARGALPLVVMLLAAAQWSFGYALELASVGLEDKIFWDNVQFLGMTLIGPAVLVFTLEYTARKAWLKRWIWPVLVVEPLITNLLAWTNPLHRLIRRSIVLDSSGAFTVLAYDWGPWMWGAGAYAVFGLVLPSLVLLVVQFVRTLHRLRRQTGTVLIGFLVPWSGALMTMFGMVPSPAYQMDLTPLTFTLGFSVIAWGLFRHRLLQFQPATYETIVSQVMNGVIVLDPQKRVVELNPAAAQMIGCTASQGLGQPITQLLSEFPELTSYFDGDREREVEIVLGKDRRRRYIELHTLPLRDSSELLTGWLLVLHDITERKQVEIALQQIKEEAVEARRVAEAANQAKSAFLAKMSHELRTPMNAVLGFSELMVNDPNLTTGQRENLGIIRRSGGHLLALINDVLDFSKIEAGKANVVLKTFDLHRMLRSLEEMFSLRAKHKGLTVNVDLASDIPRYIRADEGKLRQVLINLLSNAVKFVEEGTVTMSVSEHKGTKMDGPEADVADPRSTVLHFEIEDTGVGIAPDELERVFEAFEQTRSGHQSKQGTGLGLPISREYVQMMGGELKVTSEVGVGSCFSFDIPVDVMEADEIEERHIARHVVGLAPGQPTYKLLLVDDMRVSRMLLVKLLRPLGFDVREAADGREALEVWQAWRPDFIFMDLRMPEMNGREATRRIRAQSDDREVVIVALTAMVFEEEREAILAAGCDDIIHKPILTDAIFSTLEEYLGVEFVYEEPGEQPEKASASPEHITLDVTLDSAWVKEMRQATIEGDIQWMDRLIAHIRETNPAVAEKLTGLAYDFAHGEILDWLGDAAS
jgi:PAS domain S-box-containing protein